MVLPRERAGPARHAGRHRGERRALVRTSAQERDDSQCADAVAKLLRAVVDQDNQIPPGYMGHRQPLLRYPKNGDLKKAKELMAQAGADALVEDALQVAFYIGGIAFRAAGQPLGNVLSQAIGNPLHVAGTLSIDRWGGGEKAELRIADASRPE